MIPVKAALLKRAFQWCLLLLVTWGIARYIYLHHDDLKVIEKLDVRVLIMIALVQLVNFFIMSFRYLLIMKTLGFKIETSDWIKVFTISRFINTFLPHMGNVYRGFALKLEHGFSLASYMASLLVFSALDRLVLFSSTLIYMLFANPSQQLAGVRVTTLFAMLTIAWTGGHLLLWLGVRLLKIPVLSKRFRHLDTVVARIIHCLRQPRLVLQILGSGVISFAFSLLATWLAFYALDIRLSLAHAVLFNSLSMIVKFVPLTPGNVGTSEATYAWLSHELQLEVAPAIIAAAALNVVSYLVFFSAGMIAGGGQFMRRSAFKRLQEAESGNPQTVEQGAPQ